MMQLSVIDPIIEPILFQEWQLIRLCPYSVLLVLEPTKIATYVRTFGAAWRHIYLLALCSRNDH